jgi:GNAT superfamily N-acetyltransferase
MKRSDQTDADGVYLRVATALDAPIVAEHRVRLFSDTDRLTPAAAAELLGMLPGILRPMLESGEYLGWLLVGAEGAIVGGAGVQIRHLLPRPETLIEREALVVNVYVMPEFRHRGLARRLMQAILEWCREQGIERVVLHPSSMGNPLYNTLGFEPTNELVFYQPSASLAEPASQER